MRLLKFLLPKILAQVKCLKEEWLKGKKPIVATKSLKLQGSDERENRNCSNQVAKNERKKKKKRIVATKFPKMGGKKKKKKNYGNQVAEIVREEREIFNRNFGMPKKKIVASKIGRVNHLTFSSRFLFSKILGINSLFIPNKT